MLSKRRKIIIILSTAITVLVTLLIILSITSKPDIDSADVPPDDGIFISSSVSFVDGEKLVEALRDIDQYEQLGKDLFVFGTNAYEKYKDTPEEPLVGFKVFSVFSENNTFSFEGRFGATSNKVSVKAKRLKNDKFTIEIIDNETGVEFNSILPSNSKRSQFIGLLPIETSGYTIEYVETGDYIYINVFNSANNVVEAKKIIEEALGRELYESENIPVYGVTDSQFRNF